MEGEHQSVMNMLSKCPDRTKVNTGLMTPMHANMAQFDQLLFGGQNIA